MLDLPPARSFASIDSVRVLLFDGYRECGEEVTLDGVAGGSPRVGQDSADASKYAEWGYRMGASLRRRSCFPSSQ